MSLGKERFMRIEGFDLEEPVIGIMVTAYKVDAGPKRLRLGLVFFVQQKFPVDSILTRHTCCLGIYPMG